MKKFFVLLLSAAMLFTAVPTTYAASGRGGAAGFLIGCCFGIRNGLAYNEGKDLHFKDWSPIIPFVGFIFAIMNGIDCADGATSSDFADKYGSQFY